ncbi:putative dynactin [Diaporthe ampelina]|uniref:Putative dynactin n=1 Tax=Diaporthe ampelina TaxID=1214573 RepID=A0A0G2FW67_9PEZI|nr:putative dynactin [Diaporthe ampelina]
MGDLAAGQVIRLADGRNAVIRFVGETTFAPGLWVGVELDDGTGKNDGSVQGERYFDCVMGNGIHKEDKHLETEQHVHFRLEDCEHLCRYWRREKEELECPQP